MNILSIAQVGLIILKITHTIDWSWWLVLLPLWLYVGLVCLGWTLGFVCMIAHLILMKTDKGYALRHRINELRKAYGKK